MVLHQKRYEADDISLIDADYVDDLVQIHLSKQNPNCIV